MAPSKKNIKATKKFEKKHLKGILDKRKEVAKFKQRAQVKAHKQAKRSKDDEFYKGPKDGEAIPERRNGPGATVSDMSVDDFFKGGFEILENGSKHDKKNGKLGKRKRDEAAEDDSDSEDDGPAGAKGEDDDSEAESEAEPNMGMSQSALSALAKDDPDFYKFLQENDPEALDFDENVDLAEIDELSAGEDEEQPKKKKQKKNKKAAADDESENEFNRSNELTKSMVARWKASMTKTHSLRAAKQIVLAFRSAAHLNEEDEENKQKYTISSPEVFHDVLMVALKQLPEVLQFHVPVKESASGKVYVPTDSKKFKTLSILIRSYTASVLHLLNTLSDDATLKLTISALTPLLPYLLSFRKVLKNLIKTIVHYWSQSSSSEATRITAFLVIRRLTVIGDKGVRETILKAIYQGLIQGSRTTNVNTIQGINLMKNSAAELWGIDQNIGYTTAFTFIRQLAMHLRNSIVHNQNESYKNVYNWQYVHSLDFWSSVLAEHCNLLKEAEVGKESQLRLLIYPLVQVTLGAMRLIPTAIYFPIRFQLMRSLMRISRATGTYIPLASILLEVLNSAEMKKPPKPSTLKQLDYSVQYKAPKSYLRTRIYQDGVGEQVVELFSEYFVLWSTNIAFPEFALPVSIMLKRWLKEVRGNKGGGGNKNSKLASQVTLLVQKIEANAKFIEEKRAKIDFAPKDRTQVDAFLKDFEWEKTPIGAFVVVQRKLRAEKQKMMEDARKEDERKRQEEKEKNLQGDDEENNGSESEDEPEDDEGSGDELEEEIEGESQEEDEDDEEEEEDDE